MLGRGVVNVRGSLDVRRNALPQAQYGGSRSLKCNQIGMRCFYYLRDKVEVGKHQQE